MHKSKLKLTLLGSVAALVLAGCGGGGGGGELADGWDEIVEAAGAEGSVTLYSSHAPQNLEALKVAFEQEHPGIRMEHIRGTDAEIIPRVDIERQTGVGEADMIMVNDIGWVHRSIDAGDVATPVYGPSFTNPEYASENSVLADQFFLASATSMGLVWNTDEYPEGLRVPEDAFDPALENRVGVVNPSGFPAVVDIYRKMDTNYSSGFVKRLAETHPRIYQSSPAMNQAVASGEIAAAPAAAMDALRLKAEGAPVEYRLPEDPIGAPWYVASLESAPHPNAAQLLADFIVTQDGQEALSHNFVAVLPHIEGADVAGTGLIAQDLALTDPDEYSSGIDEFMTWWEGLFFS